jgi:sulfur carrier protein ThiS
MIVTVRLLASYRQYLPVGHDARAGLTYAVREGTRVRDLLAELPVPAKEPKTFVVNGRHAQEDQVLEEGDVLAVFPAVGGGG